MKWFWEKFKKLAEEYPEFALLLNIVILDKD